MHVAQTVVALLRSEMHAHGVSVVQETRVGGDRALGGAVPGALTMAETDERWRDVYFAIEEAMRIARTNFGEVCDAYAAACRRAAATEPDAAMKTHIAKTGGTIYLAGAAWRDLNETREKGL
jgi:hypothetical protein